MTTSVSAGSVGGAAGGEADHDRDLRDVAGGPIIASNTRPTAWNARTPSASRAPPECQMPTMGLCPDGHRS